MLRRLFAPAIFVVGCFVACPVFAQTVTGTLSGTVTDATGAVIPNAQVTAKNLETSFSRTVTTNGEGFYNMPFLPLGTYDVTVEIKGFQKTTRKDVAIELNQNNVTNFRLDVAGSTDAITITADIAPINTTDAEVKQSLNAQAIIDKPTSNPGSFLSLAEIFTGFQENPTSGQNNPTASSGSSINFNGTGTRGATFQINGVNNDDSSENQNRQGAALSTIREFQVITNNFTAEFGRGYGAVVLVQTKSGTNKFHGDLYEFHQDSALNAKSFFTPGTVKKPVNRRNQYGFTIGGPAIKERFFFFGSFDQKRESGALTYTRDLLLPSERTHRLTGANDTPANRAFIQSVINRYPANLTPNDARSNRTYVGDVGFNRPLSDHSGRLDFKVRESDNLTVRYQYTRQRFQNNDIIIGEATDQNNRQQNLGLTYTHLFTPKTVGEFRYGLGLRTTLVGIKAGNDTPIIRFTASPVSGAIIGNAGNFPINRFQTDHQYVYNISSIIGSKHSLKAGTDLRFQQLDDKADNFSRGFYTFNRICGGTTLATPYDQFLRGCVATYQKGYGPFFLENRISEANFYVEDNWKITRNFTFNLGARHEYVSAPREVADRIEYGFSDDKDNLEPRIGFAWSPNWKEGLLGKLTGGAGRTSIRGGYGIYHGRLFQSVFSQTGASVRFNPPNAALLSYTNQLNIADPSNGFVFTPGNLTSRVSLTVVDPDLQMPYTQQWSLTMERELPFKSRGRATYTGNRGIGTLRYSQGNLPVSPLDGGITVVNHPFNAPAAGFPDLRGVTINRVAANFQCAGTGLPGIATNATCPVAVPIANNEVSLRVPRTNERRPDPRYTTNLVVSNGAWSYYNGLQMEWDKAYSSGLSFKAAYTWSKSIDTTSEATFVGAGDSNQNGNNTRAARALSRFDTRHRFTLFASYLLPFLRNQQGFLGQVLGGWQVAPVIRLVSGTPFTVVGNTLDLNFDTFAERPVILDPSILFRSIDNPVTSRQQLPASAFRQATPADFGKNILGRNTFFVDGGANVELGMYKNFKMPFEGHKLTLRVEMYNAFNHVQFGFPNTDSSNPLFGTLTSTANQYNPRVVQVALRYIF
jgi:hypothetical protein